MITGDHFVGRVQSMNRSDGDVNRHWNMWNIELVYGNRRYNIIDCYDINHAEQYWNGMWKEEV